MELDFDEILLELSYRVSDGIVDLTKDEHINTLIDVLREFNVSEEIITEVVGGKKFAARNKKTKKLVYYNTRQGAQDAIRRGTHEDPGKKNKLKANEPKKIAPVTNPSDFQSSAEKDIAPKDSPDKKVVAVASGDNQVYKKDKTLIKTDTLNGPEFSRMPKENDSSFYNRTKSNLIGPKIFKFSKDIYEDLKVAPRHLNALERMMNTKFNLNSSKWSYFSDLPGGAGQISAQAGELMTLIGTSMDDNQAAKFYRLMIEHEQAQIEKSPKLQSEATRIVTRSWIDAAIKNRKAIRNRISKQYPGATIIAGSWDTEGEVVALGLNGYKKNKGFSTDVYFKVRTSDGNDVLDEVSLKKSHVVNFLNSGTGLFKEWLGNALPKEIDPKVYQDKERNNLLLFSTKNIRALRNAIAKDKQLRLIIKSKGLTLEDAIQQIKDGSGSRGSTKVIMATIAASAAQGNSASKAYLELTQRVHRTHQKNVIAALGSNRKLKLKMLESIRNEFPLKAVADGEESMAIGQNSLDMAVMQNIFETHDFEKIKQGLVAITNEIPPYLAYKAAAGGKVVPIATISVREDGVGYGGQIKFEMKLDLRFAKILAQANREIYG